MTFRRRWGRPITSLTPYSVGDALPRRNACTLTVSDRIQLLGRGPGAVSRGDQGSARDKAFRHLRGCSVVVGYREWPTKLRSGQLLHAYRARQLDRPKATRQVLQGSSFHWRPVRVPRNQLRLLTNLASRFVSPSMANKYGFSIPVYEGVDQVVEVSTGGERL